MCCSDISQEQHPLRGEIFLPSLLPLWIPVAANHIFRWFCVICFPSHQLLFIPALLPQTVFIVTGVHSTTLESRSPAGAGQIPVLLNFSAFSFSAFMTVLKSFPRHPGILLFFFSLNFPSFPFSVFCLPTAAILGALCVNEHPWSLAYVYMAWSPSTQCALLMLFSHFWTQTASLSFLGTLDWFWNCL